MITQPHKKKVPYAKVKIQIFFYVFWVAEYETITIQGNFQSRVKKMDQKWEKNGSFFSL